MLPTTRDQFKEFCLGQLGKPVINIEVSNDQVDAAVDLGLSYYSDYHFDGSEKTYFKYQITQQDKDNKYITIPENIIGISRIFPISTITSSGLFDIRYQIVLNDIVTMADASFVPYVMAMTNLAMIEQLLVGQQPIRYNRHINKLYIDTDWNRLPVGVFILAEVYKAVDPEIYQDVWKDRWLINYCTQLIKKQWGSNLKKYPGIEMPGGVKFNGQITYDEAVNEILRMEEKMLQGFALPIVDMIQ